MNQEENIENKIEVNKSLLEKAKENDQEALNTMFSQFIEEKEKIEYAEYFGSVGLLFLTHSFGCLTNKRIISLNVEPFDFMSYRDMYIEEIKGVEINQDNILRLILGTIMYILFTFGIGLLFLGRFIRTYYKINKIGITFFNSKEVEVYLFANKSKIKKMNSLWRKTSKLREKRIDLIVNGRSCALSQ